MTEQQPPQDMFPDQGYQGRDFADDARGSAPRAGLLQEPKGNHQNVPAHVEMSPPTINSAEMLSELFGCTRPPGVPEQIGAGTQVFPNATGVAPVARSAATQIGRVS